MTPRQPRGFTLMEMLIVMALLIFVITLALPTLMGSAKMAKIKLCESNVASIAQAVTTYTKEYNDIYPGYTYNGISIAWFNLWGETGTVETTAKEDRLLNRYLSNNASVTACPLDAGEDGTGIPASIRRGTSYLYSDRTDSDITSNQIRIRRGWWALERHRTSEVHRPSLKAITMDLIAFRDDNEADHKWHSSQVPLRVSVAYDDGHVEQRPKRDHNDNTWHGTFTEAQLQTLANQASSDPSGYY